MNAIAALNTALAAGVRVKANGDNLLLEAPAPPADHVIRALACHKSEILTLLRQGQGVWMWEDWQAYFDERAGIVEFDGSFSRCDAELCAFEDCVDHWLVMHPPAIAQLGSCLQCQIPVSPEESTVIQIAGLGMSGSLHANCASKWKVSRRIQARRKLSWLLGGEEVHDKS